MPRSLPPWSETQISRGLTRDGAIDLLGYSPA